LRQVGPRRGRPNYTLPTSLFGDLVVPGYAARAEKLRALSTWAAVYATKVRGEGTLRAYRSAWCDFKTWCHSLGREPLAGDPNILAMYLVNAAAIGFEGRRTRGISPASLGCSRWRPVRPW
jgi:hypothetical protein